MISVLKETGVTPDASDPGIDHHVTLDMTFMLSPAHNSETDTDTQAHTCTNRTGKQGTGTQALAHSFNHLFTNIY